MLVWVEDHLDQWCPFDDFKLMVIIHLSLCRLSPSLLNYTTFHMPLPTPISNKILQHHNITLIVFYYSTSVFEDIIDKPLVGTTSTGAVNVIFTYIALLLMDRCDRKSLVMWSIGGMFLSCLILIGTQLHVWTDTSGFATVVSVNAYVAFYAIGIGPIPVLWITEMIPSKYVSLTMSVCSQLNWIANFLVGLAFPLMREQMMGWTFVPFAVVLLASFFFVWIVLPQKRESVAVTDDGDITMGQYHHHGEIPKNSTSQDGLMKKTTTSVILESHSRSVGESQESQHSQKNYQWDKSAWV
jgi:MFS family permease